jgi:hypothetical protein
MLLGPFILKIIILILVCTFAYRCYRAFMNPNGTSTRRVVVGLASLAVSLGLFYLIDWLISLSKF